MWLEIGNWAGNPWWGQHPVGVGQHFLDTRGSFPVQKILIPVYHYQLFSHLFIIKNVAGSKEKSVWQKWQKSVWFQWSDNWYYQKLKDFKHRINFIQFVLGNLGQQTLYSRSCNEHNNLKINQSIYFPEKANLTAERKFTASLGKFCNYNYPHYKTAFLLII